MRCRLNYERQSARVTFRQKNIQLPLMAKRKKGLLIILKKVKSSPSTRHGGAWGERRYSSYSFTTSALDGGEWLASRPGRALPPGKGPPVPIVQEAGWAPEPVWTQRLEEKSSAPAGDRTSHYIKRRKGMIQVHLV
jgi:hypothetical protein